MTRKLQSPRAEDGRRRKRVLKPVVEKKRRDRINHSLAELRSLLLSQTSDARLQNPKMEKAEILDMTVEYLQRWTEEKNQRKDRRVKPPAPLLDLQQRSEAPPLTMESAGFQQCVAQLSSYIQRMAPSQRLSLVEGLKQQQQQQQQQQVAPPTGGCCRWRASEAEDPGEVGDSPGPSPRFFLFPSLSPPQPFCSTPCHDHDHASPPPSPWLSPCFSTFAASPSFPSFGPHFSPPLSSNTSLFGSSNTSFFCFPPPAALRHPPHPAAGGSSPPNSSRLWRPW
ncbi:hairy-related 11 [Nelusetta ayraudi]|uniref:hairy-related 11 n=1 Tax=Nelusetta ayraudi TaxID=303726 RepID=UPI003F70B223